MRDQEATEPTGTDNGSSTAHYGTERMQQLSGGTTDAAPEPAGEGAYGKTRIAQLRGAGDAGTEPALADDEA